MSDFAKDTNVSTNDLISRQAAISICDNAIDLWNGQLGTGALVAVRDAIMALPSAQRWISCKTAFPEKENTRVITQTNAGSVIIDCVYGGIDVYGHHVWRDGKDGLYWDDEIVAWMPIVIPEPWKGGR